MDDSDRHRDWSSKYLPDKPSIESSKVSIKHSID